MHRWGVIVGGVLWSSHLLQGAQLIVNSSFDSDLSGWTINGAVSQSSGFALIEEDPGGADGAIFQTVGAGSDPLVLSFELFIEGMSATVPGGALPDTAFGTVYFGDTPFGGNAAAGTFNESLGLFDLDRTGLSLLDPSVMSTGIAGRPGWVRFTVPLATTRNFVTFVVEETNLNLASGDSVVAVDEVTIEVIPEPSTSLLLLFVLAHFASRRARPT